MSENELRWQLRQLPREIDPPGDLWPGIAARLPAVRPASPRRWPWFAGLALAASLTLAVGLSWRQAPAGPVAEGDFRAELVRRESDALTSEYLAALGQLEGAPLPAPLQPAIDALDQSALDIRQAIATDPEAVFLIDQLRRTYARRLSLTQRAVTG